MCLETAIANMYMYEGVLCCFALFVCLTLLASFFLPSHLSFKNMYIVSRCLWGEVRTNVHVHTCTFIFTVYVFLYVFKY